MPGSSSTTSTLGLALILAWSPFLIRYSPSPVLREARKKTCCPCPARSLPKSSHRGPAPGCELPPVLIRCPGNHHPPVGWRDGSLRKSPVAIREEHQGRYRKRSRECCWQRWRVLCVVPGFQWLCWQRAAPNCRAPPPAKPSPWRG